MDSRTTTTTHKVEARGPADTSADVLISIDDAQELARTLLGEMGLRWTHVQAVAARATRVAELLPRTERAVLVAAAWLHDIGYGPATRTSGFHPLDGAVHLRGFGARRLANLVAHHSGARFEADARGMGAELADFPRERSFLAAALDWCDLTTDRDGSDASLETRVEGVFRRYGRDHPVAIGLTSALPVLLRNAQRVERRRTALARTSHGTLQRSRQWL